MSGGGSWLERLELSDGGWPGNPERANRRLLFFGRIRTAGRKCSEKERGTCIQLGYPVHEKNNTQPAGRSLFLPPRLGSY